MAEFIIGFDFGNCNSFLCIIKNLDEKTKLGGTVFDLLPQDCIDGIPSVYFYSNGTVLCGEDTLRSAAKPETNKVRFLKGHLDETFVLKDPDGKEVEIAYNDAITAVIQHCVRRANIELLANHHLSSHLVSLSYPTTFTTAERQRLIELAERATLEDGTHIKVYGTIAEPAAAALDYLAEFGDATKDTTVLVYDLGGGTFDLALVSAYPKGRMSGTGDMIYYDIHAEKGLDGVAGAAFDERLFKILKRKFNIPLKGLREVKVRELAEKAKKELTTSTVSNPAIEYQDDYIFAKVTREEFEAATEDLLAKTIELTKDMIAKHPNLQPDLIILTGGSSRMPMVKAALEAELPHFKGKIIDHRPSRAIAYGAARFGTEEKNREILGKKASASPIQRTLQHDIGIFFYQGKEDIHGHINIFLKKGTPIPCVSKYIESETHVPFQTDSQFRVFEATKDDPDNLKVDEDFTYIMAVTINHGSNPPRISHNKSRLLVDELGILHVEALNLDDPSCPIAKNHCVIQIKK